MRTTSKLLIVAGAVGLLVAIGFLVRRLGTPAPESAPPPAAYEQAATSQAGSDSSLASRQMPGPATASPTQNPAAETRSSTTPMTDWSERVDAILTAERPEADKAKELLELFPHLPEGGQVEVATHLSNLVPNQDYAPLANLLTNAALSPDVLEVFFRDALNRPNTLKLPALLDIARTPQHPNVVDAKETLAFLLGEDDGDDWAKWQAKIDEWLRANPD